MIKYFCDKCGKETKPEDIQANFQYVTDEKLQKGTKKEYCKTCLKKILKVIEDIK